MAGCNVATFAYAKARSTALKMLMAFPSDPKQGNNSYGGQRKSRNSGKVVVLTSAIISTLKSIDLTK